MHAKKDYELFVSCVVKKLSGGGHGLSLRKKKMVVLMEFMKGEREKKRKEGTMWTCGDRRWRERENDK